MDETTNLDFEETTGNTATDSLPSRSWRFFSYQEDTRKSRRKNIKKIAKQLEKKTKTKKWG